MITHWSGKAFLNTQENPKITKENSINSIHKNEKLFYDKFFLTLKNDTLRILFTLYEIE